MEWIETTVIGLIAGVLGMLMGSFLNMLVFRAKGVVPTCAEPVVPLDLVPFASFFVIKDRCEGNKRVVEWQYPALELVMGALFAGFALRAVMGVGFPEFVEMNEWWVLMVRDFTVIVFLAIIFLQDLDYSVILDRYSLPLLIIVALFSVVLGADMSEHVVASLLVGAFFGVQYLLTKGEWVGDGDIRMGLVMGMLLGMFGAGLAVLLAYMLASVVGIGFLLLRRKTLSSHMPFGTFLVAGTLISMLAGPYIIEWYFGVLGV